VLDTARVFPAETPLRTALLLRVPASDLDWIDIARVRAASARVLSSSSPPDFVSQPAAAAWEAELAELAPQGLDQRLQLGELVFCYADRPDAPRNARASALAGRALTGDVVIAQARPRRWAVQSSVDARSQVLRGHQLFNLLRPELVRASPLPLSPDAFSWFGRHNAAVHNSEVCSVHLRCLD
jgi:hypothetical protein